MGIGASAGARDFVPVDRGTVTSKKELDFETEIKKQEKRITLHYHRGMSATYTPVRYYRYCRKYREKQAQYRDCNDLLEKKRYAAWKRYWNQQKVAQGQVAGGDLKVQLVPREPAGAASPVASK
jgi:hypothetical protein